MGGDLVLWNSLLSGNIGRMQGELCHELNIVTGYFMCASFIGLTDLDRILVELFNKPTVSHTKQMYTTTKSGDSMMSLGAQ